MAKTKTIYLRLEVEGGIDPNTIIDGLGSNLDYVLAGAHMALGYPHQCRSEDPSQECVHLVLDKGTERNFVEERQE